MPRPLHLVGDEVVALVEEQDAELLARRERHGGPAIFEHGAQEDRSGRSAMAPRARRWPAASMSLRSATMPALTPSTSASRAARRRSPRRSCRSGGSAPWRAASRPGGESPGTARARGARNRAGRPRPLARIGRAGGRGGRDNAAPRRLGAAGGLGPVEEIGFRLRPPHRRGLSRKVRRLVEALRREREDLDPRLGHRRPCARTGPRASGRGSPPSSRRRAPSRAGRPRLIMGSTVKNLPGFSGTS